MREMLLCLTVLLTGCLSFEPRQLTPSITLSPEDLTLMEAAADRDGVDLGLVVSVNESDSLSNLAVLPGVRVRGVTPGGPAAVAGIRSGDVILQIDGTETNSPDAVAAIAQRGRDGQRYSVQLRRNTSVLGAELVARSQAGGGLLQELYRIDPVASRAGYRSELVQVAGEPDRVGARVVEFLPQSPLPAAGLRVDDLILAVDGAPVQSAQSLINSFNQPFTPGRPLRMTIYRDGGLLELQGRLWDPGRRVSRLALLPLLNYESSLSTDRSSLTLLDLWLFAGYRYTRSGSERQHSLLGLFHFSSDYGALLEE